jgi:hypothetical protein
VVPERREGVVAMLNDSKLIQYADGCAADCVMCKHLNDETASLWIPLELSPGLKSMIAYE